MDQQRQPFVRDESGVVTLTLTQPGRSVVVLDRELVDSVAAALDEIEAMGSDLKGFVLASASPRVFVAGADLQQIMSLSETDLASYLRFGQETWGRVARLPCTSVAAINGAALGGGLEIALHCDHLIASKPQPREPGGEAKPYQIGLPEAGLSLCPGWGGTNTLPARIDPSKAIRMTVTGQTMTVFEATETGLIEELVEPDALLDRARQLAAQPKTEPRSSPRCIRDAAYRSSVEEALELLQEDLPETLAADAVAACIEAGLAMGWQAGLDAEREHLIRLRDTEDAQDAIHAFFEKSATQHARPS